MADQTEGSIEIDATPAKIMDAIADYEAYPEWANGVKKAQILERDGQGRGSKVSFEIAQGPVKADYTLAYVYEPDHAGVSWTFVEGHGIKDLSGTYKLEPQASGVKVTYRTRLDIALRLPGFLKRQGERVIIDTALKGLKKRVESRA